MYVYVYNEKKHKKKNVVEKRSKKTARGEEKGGKRDATQGLPRRSPILVLLLPKHA